MEDPNLILESQIITSADRHPLDAFDFQSLSPDDQSYQSTQQQNEKLNPNNDDHEEYSTSPTSYLLSFDEIYDEYANLSNLSPHGSDDNSSDGLENLKTTTKNDKGGGGGALYNLSRPPLQAKNHVMAERKRRERLNQRLIALATLIPGLKKMDKASIIVDATKYIKQLEERVQNLEGEANNKEKLVEPTILSVKRSRSSSELLDGNYSSSSQKEYSDANSNKQIPKIEVKVSSDKYVLVRIHWKKKDGAITKVLSELNKFHLNISSSSILPFGDAALDITIIAQMGDEFRMEMKDLVKNLRSAVLKFM